MEMWQSLVHGFSIALQPMNMLYALIGCIVGTITGILPGIGPLGAMAILLSFTLYMDAAGAMIFFCRHLLRRYVRRFHHLDLAEHSRRDRLGDHLYRRLSRWPRKARAGAALTVSAVGSFVAGTISILGLMVATSFLGSAALKFGPPEFVAIGVCGLVLLVKLSEGSFLKSIIMIFLGMAIYSVGIDYLTGTLRFTLGIERLSQGIDFLPVAMGLFGIAEMLETACMLPMQTGKARKVKFREMLPTRKEWRRSVPPMFRGSVIGFLIGLIPGPAPMISTFVSYITEKKLSKHPEEFGQGAIEGVAGPESANNAAVGGAYVPLLALGIPFTPAMAMVLGALLLHNITPGSESDSGKAGSYSGGLSPACTSPTSCCSLLNLPMVNIFVNILRTPKQILLPVIVMLSLVGVYSVNSSLMDLLIMGLCGIIGFIFKRVGFQPAPLIIAMVIGPMLENSLRQALLISGGDIGAVIWRPICGVLYLIALGILVAPWLLKRLSILANK